MSPRIAATVGLSILIAISAAACGKKITPKPVSLTSANDAAPPAPAPPPPPEAAAAPADRALTEEELFARKSLAELNAERPLAEVRFAVDSTQIDSEARNALERNAAWLRRWPSTRVTLEGHCDSRGTAEYNLALGERRARAVRDYLVGLGVEDGRLLVISKGKEAPACSDEHESCWQQNRRAHPVITAK